MNGQESAARKGKGVRSSRTAVRLSEGLGKNLAAYALAAGAAGVGLLATAAPAEADIVYGQSFGLQPEPGTYPFDLNNDGVTDFSFHVASYEKAIGNFASLAVSAKNNNGVLMWPLAAGYTVGPGENFVHGDQLLSWLGIFPYCYEPFCFAGRVVSGGPWAGAQFAALGLTFSIDGETHYGYARIGWYSGGQWVAPPQFYVQAYAYETVPNMPIVTTLPEPGTLGLLALGSLGLGFWRRRKAVPSSH